MILLGPRLETDGLSFVTLCCYIFSSTDDCFSEKLHRDSIAIFSHALMPLWQELDVMYLNHHLVILSWGKES